MQNNTNSKLIIIAEIISVIFIISLFFVDYGKILNTNKEEIFITSKNPCELRKQACQIEHNNQKYTLDITPRGLPCSVPLKVKFTAKDLAHNNIELKIYGVNMNMGIYKSTLKRTSSDTFEGNTTLPSCIGAMIWNGEIASSSFGKNTSLRWTFKTTR